MKKTRATGLMLRTAEKTAKNTIGYAAVRGVLSLLVLGALACLLEGVTGLFALPGAAALWIGGGLVCLLRQLFRNARRFVPGVLLAAAVLTAACFRSVADGLCLVFDHARPIWMAASGKIILEMAVVSGPERHALCLWLFLLVAGILLGLLSCAAAERCPRIGGLVLLLLLIGELLAVQWSWVHLVCAAAALCLLAVNGAKDPKGWSMVLLQSGVVILCGALLLAGAGLIPGASGRTVRLRAQMEDALHSLRYEKNGVILPEGRFERLAERAEIDGAVLEVFMERPETLYLRGFVGEEFDGDGWKPASEALLAQHSDLLYWLHDSGFYPQSQLGLAAELLRGEAETNRISVKNPAACGQYAYLPYQLSGPMSGVAFDPAELESSTVYSDGAAEYSFAVIDRASEQIPTLLEELRSADGAERYRKAESGWRELAEEMSLGLPEELPGSMRAALEACCQPYGGREGLNREQAELCVLEFVETYLNGEKREQLTLPLEETAAGTEYQTVTATVLAMRWFGIPARYAEGFVVTEELAASVGPGQPIPVGADCAHPWVEIYQDGLGWMPLAEAPGYQTLSGAVSESGQQNTGAKPEDPEDIPQGDELEEDPAERDPEQDPQRQPHTRLPEHWPVWVILGAVLLLILLAAAVILRRHRILKRRAALLNDPDPNEAAAALISDGAALLARMGVKGEGRPLSNLCPSAADRFGPAYGALLSHMCELNGEARFSSHVLTEAQLASAREFREETLRHLKTELKWPGRLRARWIECVY